MADRTDVLVVDDDEVFGRVLTRALMRRKLGFQVARTAEQAIRIARAASPRRVILDLNLAGENGLSLVEPLKHAAPGCRIVVLTGYATIETAIEAIKRGVTHYLTKPADVDAILAAFEADGPQESLPPVGDVPSVPRVEWEHIQRVLGINHGNISAAARALKMHRRTLQRKLLKNPARK